MSNITYLVIIPFLRQPLGLLIIYCVAYGVVFVLGIVGNSFVVLSLLRDPMMRNVTNYLISSLAISDLLICIFCLPATLFNNILMEWLLGNVMCKMQVWISGTSVCASVYTLVAVAAERYMAICHSFKHKRFTVRNVFLFLFVTWSLSSLLFIPWLVYFKEVKFPVNVTFAKVCTAEGFTYQKWYFVFVNFIVAFVIPLILIIVLYAMMFFAIFYRRQPFAVDKGALAREHRMRIRITIMMLVVIILFAVCWLPLYLLFTIINFSSPSQFTMDHPLHTILRPLFQWLSLANSCINPFLYAFFNAKFRRAFVDLIVYPCRRHYSRFRHRTRETMRKVSSKTHGKLSTTSFLSGPTSTSHPPSRIRKASSFNCNVGNNNNYAELSPTKILAILKNNRVSHAIPNESSQERNVHKSNSLNQLLSISKAQASKNEHITFIDDHPSIESDDSENLISNNCLLTQRAHSHVAENQFAATEPLLRSNASNSQTMMDAKAEAPTYSESETLVTSVDDTVHSLRNDKFSINVSFV